MKLNLLFLVVWALALGACHTHNHDNQNEQGHNHETFENHESEHDHDRKQEQVENYNDYDDEHVKVQYTANTRNFELFAEADAFVAGEQANFLSHFSKLPSFKPFESAKVTAIFTINGKDVKQMLPEPTRTGIYSFDITPYGRIRIGSIMPEQRPVH